MGVEPTSPAPATQNVQVTNAASITSIAAGSSAQGAGAVLDNVAPRSWHSMAIIGSAGITAGAVTLQGSHDNVNWFTLAGPTNAVASTVTPASNAAGIPARYVRANITTAITGGTVQVTIASAT